MEQFSTSLAFLGAQNLIRWAAEITGQLLSNFVSIITEYFLFTLILCFPFAPFFFLYSPHWSLHDKKNQTKPYMDIHSFYIMILDHDHTNPYITINEHTWTYIWPFTTMHDHTWQYTNILYKTLPNMTIHNHAIHDPA